VEACRAHREAARAALWLGPHEWLLLAPEAEGADIPAAFAAAMADRPYSLVDVGHRSLALEISGAEAGPLLNAGCPLDLDIGAFPVGMCTRTILGKAQIVLWRTAPDSFTLDVWRSFSAYVWEFLEEARRGL
jgi:sarcosine oxidase subunit gamma